MIIDVVDLNLETLRFSRRYDPSRYKRGRVIYNNEKVLIDMVNKIDEEEFNIEATVEGNYDTYKTTLEIWNGNILWKTTKIYSKKRKF